MIIHPNHFTIGALFSQNFVFNVPKYQRYYSWGQEQISDLLKDLELCRAARANGTPRSHFLGGLVTVEAKVPGTARQNVEVIDGQQRLASFVMLMVQLRNAMGTLAQSGEVKSATLQRFLVDKADLLKHQYECYKDTINMQVVEIPRLELSKPDKTFFARLLIGANPAVERESHELLRSAFERIGSHLAKLVSDEATEKLKVQSLSLVSDAIEQDWTIIHMATTLRSDAYMLFQVLNDRGTGLTEGELLRSKTLEILDLRGTQMQQQAAEEHWDTVLRVAPEKVEEGLRWVYASRVGQRPGKTTLFDEFLDRLFPVHAKPKPSAAEVVNLVTTVGEIRVEFEKMAKIVQGEWPYTVQQPVTMWDRDRLRLLVVELKHTNCMPLLIAALALDHKKFSEIVQLLERFVFRYKIIVGAHIGAATNVYHEQALLIRKSPATYKVSSLQSAMRTLLDTSAGDAIFGSRLSDQEYSLNASNKSMRYLLMTLEHYRHWYVAGARGKPRCQDKSRVFDFANTSIEHVYPQNASQKDAALEPLINNLGNLTFMSPAENDGMGNKGFALKKPLFATSSVFLNHDIAKASAWNAAAIDLRRDTLIKMAQKVFVI